MVSHRDNCHVDAADIRVELRRAVADCDWDAVRLHAGAVLETGEDAEALAAAAAAAWWLDDAQTVFDARERLFRLYRRGGDDRAAARVALQLSWDSTLCRGGARMGCPVTAASR